MFIYYNKDLNIDHFCLIMVEGALGTRFGSLELKIRSLESEKIIIGSLQVHTGYLTFSLKKTWFN